MSSARATAMEVAPVTLGDAPLGIADLGAVARARAPVAVSPAVHQRMVAARRVVDELALSGFLAHVQ